MKIKTTIPRFLCEKYSKIVFDFLNYLETTHPVILSHVGKKKGRCISASQTNQDQSSFIFIYVMFKVVGQFVAVQKIGETV